MVLTICATRRHPPVSGLNNLTPVPLRGSHTRCWMYQTTTLPCFDLPSLAAGLLHSERVSTPVRRVRGCSTLNVSHLQCVACGGEAREHGATHGVRVALARVLAREQHAAHGALHGVVRAPVRTHLKRRATTHLSSEGLGRAFCYGCGSIESHITQLNTRLMSFQGQRTKRFSYRHIRVGATRPFVATPARHRPLGGLWHLGFRVDAPQHFRGALHQLLVCLPFTHVRRLYPRPRSAR